MSNAEFPRRGLSLLGAVRVMWLYLLPAALSAATLKFLLPPMTMGEPACFRFLRSHLALSLGALFLLFSWLAHEWRFDLWGMQEPKPQREGPQRQPEQKTQATHFGDALLAVILAAALAMGLRSAVAESLVVESGSMLPTFEPEDRVLVSKWEVQGVLPRWGKRWVPQRGAVIVFRSAAVGLDQKSTPEMLIKRVIGLPGDRVRMRGTLPVVNEEPVRSCESGEFLYPLLSGDGEAVHGQLRVEFWGGNPYLTLHAPGARPFEAVYTVGPDEVFVLGDNRATSIDSRAWNGGNGGGVPISSIEGEAKWFLAGTHASGELDLQHLLSPIHDMQSALRSRGFDTSATTKGIARCLSFEAHKGVSGASRATFLPGIDRSGT